jgi:hypothetical protein
MKNIVQVIRYLLHLIAHNRPILVALICIGSFATLRAQSTTPNKPDWTCPPGSTYAGGTCMGPGGFDAAHGQTAEALVRGSSATSVHELELQHLMMRTPLDRMKELKRDTDRLAALFHEIKRSMDEPAAADPRNAKNQISHRAGDAAKLARKVHSEVEASYWYAVTQKLAEQPQSAALPTASTDELLKLVTDLQQRVNTDLARLTAPTVDARSLQAQADIVRQAHTIERMAEALKQSVKSS